MISVFLVLSDDATTSPSPWTGLAEDIGDKYPEVGDGDKNEEDELDSFINFGAEAEAEVRGTNVGFNMVDSVHTVQHRYQYFTRVCVSQEFTQNLKFVSVTTVDWPAGVRWQSARDPELSLCTRISSTSAVTTRRDTTFFAQSVTPPSSGTRTSRKTR